MPSFTPRLLLACVVGAVASAAVAASATSVLYLTDAEQARLSTAVVVAEIGAARTFEDEARGHIFTHTTVRVSEVLYGSAPGEVTIVQSGGTVAERTLYIPGDARLEGGERCVLFLRETDGAWFLTALEQSKYTIEGSPLGPRLTRPKLGGLFARDADGALQPTEEPVKPVLLLSAFRASMKALGAEGAK